MELVDASGAIQAAVSIGAAATATTSASSTTPPTAKKFVQICDRPMPRNQLIFAPPSYTGANTIYAIDMQREIGNYSDIGNIVLGAQGGYWVTVSKSRASTAGMADVHLLHFATGAPDKDLIISTDATLNNRSNHLATSRISARLLAAWETASAANDFTAFTRRQAVLRSDGAAQPHGRPC